MESVAPRVAIVIANHNYGQYIDRAIQSVLNQNYPKEALMLMVVDDGSTDNSWEVIKKYAPNYTEEVAIHEGVNNGVRTWAIKLDTSSGPSQARNEGLGWLFGTEAPVDIIGILDADDEMLPNKTTHLVNELILGKGFVGVAYADYINVDENCFEKIEYKEPFNRDRLHEECIVHSGSFITKEALEFAFKDGYYYDPEMRTCEDYDLWCRISRKYMITHVPMPLTKVLVHSQNSTNTVRQEVWQKNWQRIWNKLTASR